MVIIYQSHQISKLSNDFNLVKSLYEAVQTSYTSTKQENEKLKQELNQSKHIMEIIKEQETVNSKPKGKNNASNSRTHSP